ncbi:hypothetical protein RJ55_04229 [Drechmeria coniospora]|nr:hypothetical protein RJ55_04229 [Drechmeria coniospora]
MNISSPGQDAQRETKETDPATPSRALPAPGAFSSPYVSFRLVPMQARTWSGASSADAHQYCDARCRERDRPSHNQFCRADLHLSYADIIDHAGEEGSADIEADAGHDWFWSNHAATDVLQLEKNEGKYYNGDLHLLLAGDAALRHLIYSVVKMPETASPTLCFCINERSYTQVARTLYALHLLFDQSHDAVHNAETLIHLWYSSRIPLRLHDRVNSVVMKSVLYDIERYCAHEDKEDTAERHNRYRFTWRAENVLIQSDLKRDQWRAIKDLLDLKPMHRDFNTLLFRQRDDKLHAESPVRFIARMTHSRAMGRLRWRADGILLPFGHPRDDFTVLNPLFFRSSQGDSPTTCDVYPPGASREPLAEWPMELLDYPDPLTQNDVYGKMFYWLRDLLVAFQSRVKGLSMTVRLSCGSLDQVPDWPKPLGSPQGEQMFDRIEVGRLWDDEALATLASCRRLLRHRDENPFAALLTRTRKSVSHALGTVLADLEGEKRDMLRPTNTVLDEHAPPVPAEGEVLFGDLLRRHLGLLMWRNWDKFSSRYLQQSDIFGFDGLIDDDEPVRSVVTDGFVGIKVRQKHRITKRWPNRLVHSRKESPTLRDFNRWLGWAELAPERWLEWTRVDDLCRSGQDELVALIRSTELRNRIKVAAAAVAADDDGPSAQADGIAALEEGLQNMAVSGLEMIESESDTIGTKTPSESGNGDEEDGPTETEDDEERANESSNGEGAEDWKMTNKKKKKKQKKKRNKNKKKQQKKR